MEKTKFEFDDCYLGYCKEIKVFDVVGKRGGWFCVRALVIVFVVVGAVIMLGR